MKSTPAKFHFSLACIWQSKPGLCFGHTHLVTPYLACQPFFKHFRSEFEAKSTWRGKTLGKSNLSKRICLLVSSKRSLGKEVSFYFQIDKFIKKVSSSFGHPRVYWDRAFIKQIARASVRKKTPFWTKNPWTVIVHLTDTSKYYQHVALFGWLEVKKTGCNINK